MKITRIALIALVVVLVGGIAGAQTIPPPNAGAFDRLSPGNQKIAQALFDAQQRSTTPTTATPLSLDDIAAAKQGGQGWGRVFKTMKTQGLVDEKNLGQAVSRFNHTAHSSKSSTTIITTGSGKTVVVGRGSGSGKPTTFTKGGPSDGGTTSASSSSFAQGNSGHGGGAGHGGGGGHGGGRGK